MKIRNTSAQPVRPWLASAERRCPRSVTGDGVWLTADSRQAKSPTQKGVLGLAARTGVRNVTARKELARFTDPGLLEQLRRKRDLSAGQLAKAVGVSRPTIRRWEQGQAGAKRGIPADRMWALVHALRLDSNPEVLGQFTVPDCAPPPPVPAPALSRVDTLHAAYLAQRSTPGHPLPAVTGAELYELGLLICAMGERLIGKRRR